MADLFTVTEVIDGDTFKVEPNWEWEGKSGNTVRPTGYDTPEEGQSGYQAAKLKLTRLILGKKVELKNPVNISYGRLVCDVYLNGTKLADYFAEYQ